MSSSDQVRPKSVGKPVIRGTTQGPGAARWSMAEPWISLVARLGLAAMWLYYSVPKLSYSSDALQLAVREYQIGPTSLANTFGTVQPYLELALGLVVLVGLGTRLVAVFSGLLLLVYIGSIISLGARGIAINCGCGGVASTVAAGHTRYTLDVLRDVGYLVPAVWLVWRPRSPLSLDRWLLGEPAESAEPTRR
jgi:uncharacterized membrane protein YphA (DoxX/SURF4 family)